jgi:hypothetical protein
MDNERRQRFIDFFSGPPYRGDRGKLIAKTGYTKGRIAQYFDENQPFGERAARELAIRLDLPKTYFELERPVHAGGLTSVLAAPEAIALTAPLSKLINDLAAYFARADEATRAAAASALPRIALNPDEAANVGALLERMLGAERVSAPPESAGQRGSSQITAKNKRESPPSRYVAHGKRPALTKQGKG